MFSCFSFMHFSINNSNLWKRDNGSSINKYNNYKNVFLLNVMELLLLIILTFLTYLYFIYFWKLFNSYFIFNFSMYLLFYTLLVSWPMLIIVF